MNYTYNHRTFTDEQMDSIKLSYARLRERYNHQGAMRELTRQTGYDYYELCSAVATRKKPVSSDVQLTLAF